jgi:hypothetical protein
LSRFLRIPVTGEQYQLISADEIILIEQASPTTVTVLYKSGVVLIITHAAAGAGVETERDALQDALIEVFKVSWTFPSYTLINLPFAVSGIVLDTGDVPTITSVSAAYSILVTDYTVECTANTFTVTLPTAVGVAGKLFNIKNSGTGVVTVATTSSQTIDGGLTAVLSTQYESITIQSTGSNWIII